MQQKSDRQRRLENRVAKLTLDEEAMRERYGEAWKFIIDLLSYLREHPSIPASNAKAIRAMFDQLEEKDEALYRAWDKRRAELGRKQRSKLRQTQRTSRKAAPQGADHE